MAIVTRNSVTEQQNYTKYGYHNVKEAIQEYYENYPMEQFKTLPEFAIKKLGLEANAITSVLPNPDDRSREQLRDWMKCNLSLSDVM